MDQVFVTVDYQTRAEIEEIIHLHAWLLDHGRGEEIIELYTPDGVLLGVGPDRIGRAGVLDYTKARKPSRTARHVCSNLRVQQLDSKRATSTFMIALFRSDDRPPLDATPIALADINDAYERCDDGRWRISERRVTIVFEADAHRAQQVAAPHVVSAPAVTGKSLQRSAERNGHASSH